MCFTPTYTAKGPQWNMNIPQPWVRRGGANAGGRKNQGGYRHTAQMANESESNSPRLVTTPSYMGKHDVQGLVKLSLKSHANACDRETHVKDGLTFLVYNSFWNGSM